MRAISFPTPSFVAFSLCALGLTGVTACGGGGGSGGAGGGSSTTEASGQIFDALAEGLHYSSGSVSGLTDANGNFVYQTGSPVTFSIGDIVLGSADGSSLISIPDLVEGVDTYDEEEGMESEVLNIAQFLQTIDADGDPTNGIRIDAATREAAAGQTMQFDLVDWDEDEDVNATLELLTTNELVSEEQAAAHGNAWLASSRVGEYSGTWSLDGYEGFTGREIHFSISNHGDICVVMSSDHHGSLFFNGFASYGQGQPEDGWAPNADGVFYIIDQKGEVQWEWSGVVVGETIEGQVTRTQSDSTPKVGTFTASLTHKTMSFLDMDHLPDFDELLNVAISLVFFNEGGEEFNSDFHFILTESDKIGGAGDFGRYGPFIFALRDFEYYSYSALQVTGMTGTVMEFRGWFSGGVWVTGELEVLDTEFIVSGSYSILSSGGQWVGTFSGSRPRG